MALSDIRPVDLPFLAFAALVQPFASLAQQLDTRAQDWRARDAARRSGKPLLVVGGPSGSSPLYALLGYKAHACGDVCLDVSSMACAGCNFVQGDVRRIPFPDRYFGAALVPHVLEHLESADEAAQAWRELHRVADAVFLAAPTRDTLLGWLAPEHHLWVWEVGQNALAVEERAGRRRTTIVS